MKAERPGARYVMINARKTKGLWERERERERERDLCHFRHHHGRHVCTTTKAERTADALIPDG